MMDEHDLTDPHGEAEALRRENARLRRWNKRLRAALAASRAPDPVVNAGSCQPGDLISRAAIDAAKSTMVSEARNAMPFTGDDELDHGHAMYRAGICDFANRLSALPAAPVAEAQPVAQCCMCGKTGLSTAEDGGPECQLEDGRWVCTAECYDLAVPEPTIGGAELDGGKHDGFDTTGQDVQQESQRVNPGLYEVFWKSGGSSFAAFGCTANGDNWFAPTNWLRPIMLRDIKTGECIERIAALTPPQDAELDALVATLRAVANGEIWRLKDIRGDYGLCDTAADAITALRAQPDWKAMAERLGEELDFLLYAITATDQYDNRFLTITGSTPMLKQLLEAESASRAALSDLAKMKGE